MLARAHVALAAVAVVLVAVAACGSGGDDTQADRPTGTTAAPTTTTTAPTASTASTTGTRLAPSTSTTTTAPVPDAGGVLVELTSSGGLAGRGAGGLVVTASGEVTATRPTGQVTHGTLAADEVRALADLLAGTDFAALRTDPGPGSSCADAFAYVVRYRQWAAGADDCTTPAELAPILDRLQDIQARFA